MTPSDYSVPSGASHDVLLASGILPVSPTPLIPSEESGGETGGGETGQGDGSGTTATTGHSDPAHTGIEGLAYTGLEVGWMVVAAATLAAAGMSLLRIVPRRGR